MNQNDESAQAINESVTLNFPNWRVFSYRRLRQTKKPALESGLCFDFQRFENYELLLLLPF